MEEFVRSIPAAASSPYALAAYSIAAVLFLFAGARLRMAKLLLAKIASIPEGERRRVVEIATGTVLPTHISPEQWIRHSRMRWAFLLLGALLITILTVATIAIVNPTPAKLADIKRTAEETAKKTQEAVQAGTKSTSEKIDQSTEQIVTTIQDAALATLETMFPLAVRIEREVDGTIMHLDGRRRQELVSFDKNFAPMKLHWGDRFFYSIVPESSIPTRVPESSTATRPRRRYEPSETSAGVSLEVSSRNNTRLIALRLQDPYIQHEIRIPGSSPEPMDAFFVNEDALYGIGIKISIVSADRERGREEFRKALMNTTLDSAAQRIYQEVSGDGVRLRSSPSETGQVFRAIVQGTYVKVKERSAEGNWCQIRLPEGREGWIKCDFLKSIQPTISAQESATR